MPEGNDGEWLMHNIEIRCGAEGEAEKFREALPRACEGLLDWGGMGIGLDWTGLGFSGVSSSDGRERVKRRLASVV